MRASAARRVAPVTDTPDESWGFNGRATWEPIFDTGKIVHLGVSGYYRTALKSGDIEDAVRLSDRPNIRVDNGNIADSGVITDAKSLRYAGARSRGRVRAVDRGGRSRTLVGQPRQWLLGPALHRLLRLCELFPDRRDPPVPRRQFRPRPAVQGTWQRRARRIRSGAALRLDRPEKTHRSWPAPATRRAADAWAQLVLQSVRQADVQLGPLQGDNTPLDPIGTKTRGDAFATRLHLDF